MLYAEASKLTPSKCPKYDYVIGPFKTRKQAKKRINTPNLTGTFNDPFCNGGEGR